MAPATDSGDVAGSAALAASQEVTEEMMKKKTLSIIDEFLNIRDNKVSKSGLICLESVF